MKSILLPIPIYTDMQLEELFLERLVLIIRRISGFLTFHG